MGKYRKKPVVIEAVQWNGSIESTTEILHWMFPDLPIDASANELTIQTLEGDLHASPNDWIIKGIKGEFYPCKPDIFKETYESLDDWMGNGMSGSVGGN